MSGRTIHFAPEPAVTQIVKPLATNYQTADLTRRDCDLTLNVEQIDLPDQRVDTFVLCHVLEHVNDEAALKEMYRCLRPGGRAIIMVPVIEGWNQTYENPDVNTNRDRNLHFGQADHIRYYGADVRERIRRAGFSLDEYEASGEDCVKYGLVRGETVFIATK